MIDSTPNSAKRIFKNHYDYYKEIGIETIKQQAGQLQQVGSDYQGRVIYELLQNAFDKAESKILVQIQNNKLIVANDGIKFSYSCDFDYQNGDAKRGDFQSLCSISTSTKDIETSIGNKGVGFKSVFSIAEHGYVNVYTNGEIISEQNPAEVEIDFRIYEMFKNVNEIKTEFDHQIIENIKNKISQVQMERKDWGVPGYYFPLQIEKRTEEIEKIFNDGYVTIIEVPFSDHEKANIALLFKEIQEIHFQFIQLKHNKSIVVEFHNEDASHNISIENKDNGLFIGNVNPNVLKPLAEEAGIHINETKVAIYFNKNGKSYLYNYLPTKVSSPLKYFDFHADFHTTVDRKSINFEGKIGLYNKTLLRACIELYFIALNSYINIDKRVKLDTKYIKENDLNIRLEDFKWDFLNFNNTDEIFDIVRSVLQIWNINSYNYSYQLASEFIAKLAAKYFEKERDIKDHDSFFLILNKFILKFAKGPSQYEFWKDYFKDQIVSWLRRCNAKIIPGIGLLTFSELLYRSTSKEDAIQLPSFMEIKVTDFKIDDAHLREKFAIKEFTDFNEVLKYFKQCSQSGDINNRRITEAEQAELLKSIYQIFLTRRNQKFLTSHRFSKIFDIEMRRSNSALNQATFSVSTVFLKLLDGKFKPAQLCRLFELDLDFLPKIPNQHDLKNFLKYLGVSLFDNYIIADKRLWEKFKDGVDFIPGLINRYQQQEEISEKMLQHVYFIKHEGIAIHPALINGNYKFLYSINDNYIKEELENLLVKNYLQFPVPYREILGQRMQESFNYTEDVIRLYQIVFSKYVYDNYYLIIENGKLSWSRTLNFHIVKSRKDFENCVQFANRKILCYYSSYGIPNHLIARICSQKSGRVDAIDLTENFELKKSLDQKMIYLLLNISLSKLTELNYLQTDKDVNELQERFRKLIFIESAQLKQELVYENLGALMIEREYAIDPNNDGRVYLKKFCKKSIQALAIGEYLFNNRSVKELVELILFHKDVGLLKEEAEEAELSTIRKKWKADYSERFVLFQQEILRYFGYEKPVDENWNIYNAAHISSLLIEIDSERKIQDLKNIIEKTKNLESFEGYFDDFELLIDVSHITNKAAELILFLESQQEVNFEIVQKIKDLSNRLGVEDELNNQENNIKEIYKKEIVILHEAQSEKEKELEVENKIEAVCYNLNITPKTHLYLNMDGKAVTEPMTFNKTKVIYKSNGQGENSQEISEITGITGEEEVLSYYINEFIKLGKEERKSAIISVYNLLEQKVGDESHKKYMQNCLDNLSDDQGFRKALVPFLYVTLHYKFSYFDLIGYKNGKPIMVEVKTTCREENYSFNLPINEINAARGDDEYEIVRVTPKSIYFIGNPIKQVEEKIALIKTDKFQLIPKNYEFTFFK